MRIGFVVHRSVPNHNYRALGPARAMEVGGHIVEMVEVQRNLRVDIERLRRCDVVHIYRLTNKETIACIDDLQQRGIAIVWDNDDDVRLVPAAARRYTRYTDLEAEQEFRQQQKVFKRADLVTTTSATLAARWRAAGASAVEVIPNYVYPQQYTQPRTEADVVTVGWMGGREHQVDADVLSISEVISSILARHPGVRVRTIGVRLDVSHERYEHQRLVSFPDLKEALREWDVGISPIADFAMNDARSDIKIKEYAAAGVPWLASARGPYASYGPREGGALVEDDGWERALHSVVRSRLTRFRMRRRAIAWGRSQCIDRHVTEWVTAFETAIGIAEDRRSAERSQRAPAARAGA